MVLVPDVSTRLVKAGFDMWVEAGAGERAFFPAMAYETVGAQVLVNPEVLWGGADVVLKVRAPGARDGSHEADLLRPGAVLIDLLNPQDDPALWQRLVPRRVTAFAIELIPHISRAQGVDVLTSQAVVVRYKAILLAASALGKSFPMLVLVIGAGVAGSEAIATALQAGMTVHDLAALELAYAPPFAAAKDPVNLAGIIAQNILVGEANVIQWHEIGGLDLHKSIILDVPDNAECQHGYIPGSVRIQLPRLRSRLSELPRGREIIPYCPSGQRSYDACRILNQHGFRVRRLTGSYRTWPTATIRRNTGHCSDLAESPH